MAYSAAGIYAGAIAVNVVEEILPGTTAASIGPGVVAAPIVPLLLAFGARLARWLLFAAGPIGVGLITWALATTPNAGDGAVLYMWPVLWTSAFFGTAGAVAIVGCVGVAHGVALLTVLEGEADIDRWIDVLAAVSVVAVVVRVLAERNRALLAALTAEARTDALTGLLNRRGLRERMDVELARAAREGTSLALVVFDVDDFKEVNDRCGHEVGDRVLALLGRILGDEARDVDIAARPGGDEFCVVLTRGSEAEALTFAERIRGAFADGASALRLKHGVPGTLSLTLSAGVACASGAIDEDALNEAADTALYSAKAAGRDQAATAQPLDRA